MCRRGDSARPEKQWSDTADLLELLEATDEALAADLASAPDELVTHMAEVLEKVCVTDARYTRARLTSGRYRTYEAGLAIGARLATTLRTLISNPGPGSRSWHSGAANNAKCSFDVLLHVGAGMDKRRVRTLLA